MKTLAVSQRVDEISDRQETRDSLDQRLVDFLLQAGYNPVPVPNRLLNDRVGVARISYMEKFLKRLLPHAIVLSGGNDLGQSIDRDSTEEFLLDYAEKQGIPVLGICRGMQMMAHKAGVELRAVSEHIGVRHQVFGEICREVNSFHSFSLADCPPGYDVIAISKDNKIEAIRRKELPWEGWMWHPEREKPYECADIHRLKQLFG